MTGTSFWEREEAIRRPRLPRPRIWIGGEGWEHEEGSLGRGGESGVELGGDMRDIEDVENDARVLEIMALVLM